MANAAGPGEIIFVGGRFLATGEPALVDLRDRAYLFGDSVFATLRAVSGVAFAVDRHLARLRDAADALGIEWPGVDLEGVVGSAIARLGAGDATLRVTLGRGAGPWGVDLRGPFTPSLSVVARPTTPYPADAYARGIDATVVSTRRVPAACMPSRHKTGNYLPTVLARRELAPRGLIEGIQLSVGGHVSSGTISNLFAVIGGRLVTPSLASDCRDGVTRELLLELAPSLGVEVEERAVLPSELAGASEVFFASTLMDALPVRTIEGIATYGRAPTAERLRDALTRMRGDEQRRG